MSRNESLGWVVLAELSLASDWPLARREVIGQVLMFQSLSVGRPIMVREKNRTCWVFLPPMRWFWLNVFLLGSKIKTSLTAFESLACDCAAIGDIKLTYGSHRPVPKR